MSEWNDIHEKTFPHKTKRVHSARWTHAMHHSVTYYEHTMNIIIMSKWSSRTSDQFIWLVSEQKTETVNAYLVKNSKGKGDRGGWGRGGGGTLTSGSTAHSRETQREHMSDTAVSPKHAYGLRGWKHKACAWLSLYDNDTLQRQLPRALSH